MGLSGLDYLKPQITPFERAIHGVLDDWFQAMESGSADLRLPREYPKAWTDAQLEYLVVTAIDDYVDKQRGWIKTNRDIVTDAHCGFQRLGPVQRLALAQDLDEVCVTFEQPTGLSTYDGAMSYG